MEPLQLELLSRLLRLERAEPLVNQRPIDRRATDRIRLRIPLQIKALGTLDHELVAESVDISATGVLIQTALPLLVGAALDVRLKLSPSGDGTASEWRCRGRVVHVRPVQSLQGMERVGVCFERLDAVR
jgi:c-di-GMP-binding flagellar brake protein YcgR